MLRDTGFMAGASPALTEALEQLADTVTLEDGDTLFSEGDPGDAFFAVRSGALDISILSAEGKKLSLCIMGEGECLGEISLFDPDVRTATATAIEPTILWRIDSANLKREIAAQPALAGDLLMLAGRRMRWMATLFSEQALMPLSVRLARRLIYLSRSRGDRDMIEMSHARLADFAGSTREAVSRQLSEWKKAGVVELLRVGVRILDAEALEEIAETPLI